MCGTKTIAASKLDHLIQAMDRLSAALERNGPGTGTHMTPPDYGFTPNVADAGPRVGTMTHKRGSPLDN